jgi:hypothetical protein
MVKDALHQAKIHPMDECQGSLFMATAATRIRFGQGWK